MTGLLRKLRDDRGRISVFFAILAPAFLAIAGLVVDGGAKVRALQRADDIAAEAARTAGQAIEAGPAIAGGAKQLDPTAAVTAAQTYLAALDGVTGTITIIDANHLRVTVNVTYNALILDHLGGPGATTVSGSATATLITQ